MRRLIFVACAVLFLTGTSSLALSMDDTKDKIDDRKDVMKPEEDTMKSDMNRNRGGKKGPIMQYREKMKAKRHEMLEKMKAHKEAAMANPPATALAPSAAPTP